MAIAILGGTGALGRGLAWRWAAAGHHMIIGSRSPERAAQTAEAVKNRVPGAAVEGMTYLEAAKVGHVVVLTVPFSQQLAVLGSVSEHLRGKILLDVTVPLRPPRVSVVQLPAEDSAAVCAQRVLGPEVRVVSAFHNISAQHMQEGGATDCDVLIFGDDLSSCERVRGLVDAAGFRGILGGPLANSTAAEALTSVLIWINKHHQADGAGIRVTGLPQG